MLADGGIGVKSVKNQENRLCGINYPFGGDKMKNTINEVWKMIVLAGLFYLALC